MGRTRDGLRRVYATCVKYSRITLVICLVTIEAQGAWEIVFLPIPAYMRAVLAVLVLGMLVALVVLLSLLPRNADGSWWIE